ncbi:MAG: iron-containing alcohol dehydrogenase [Pseudomonadota bacterium]|nr:iron-containing alcohol dehydrogenase [Pseudomonadota bacterium]
MSQLATILKAKTKLAAIKVIINVVPAPRPLVLLGSGSAQRLCDTISHIGARRVLVVTDAVLVKLGMVEPLLQRLAELNIETCVFSEVTPDPTLAVVEQGVAMLHSTRCDAVLAVGGGSSIDAAKVIALAASNHKTPQQLIGILKGKQPSLPLFVVPTTAGTGSEVTAGAVISDAVTHQKNLVLDPKVVPLATAIDPSIMQGMPPHITADTGVDALTHALEAWMSEFANAETDYYASAAIRMVLQHLPTAYQNGKDLMAREALGLAAHYAGLAINQAALGYVHGLAHQLGAYYSVPHGRANALVLPHILAFNQKASEARLALLARRLGLVEDNTADAVAAAKMIQQINQLLATLNIPTGLPTLNADDFADIAEKAFTEVHGTYAVPRYMTAAQARQILIAIKNG